MVIEEVPSHERSGGLSAAVTALWERSVRATHGFLSEDDITGMRPEVGGYVSSVQSLAFAKDASGRVLGFAGAADGKLEMLFVDDDARGTGVGKALLAHAVDAWDVHRLDVNEQNPQAQGFYEHEGWQAVYRSSVDSEDRPFPIVHMVRSEGIRAEMASGEWYEAADPSLAVDRLRGRRLLRAYDDAYYADEGATALLRSALGAVGFASSVTPSMRVDYGYNVYLGDRCYFNYDCTFLDGARIVFGDDVWVAPRCVFATPVHPLHADDRSMAVDENGTATHLAERNLPIFVEDRVWIASNVTVTGGVRIGEGAVIGAGSVVTRDIPPFTFACGVPCRPKREITDADRLDPAIYAR